MVFLIVLLTAMMLPPVCRTSMAQGSGASVIMAEGLLHFAEGLAGVYIKGKWGFVDKTGNQVIPPIFDEILNFRQDYAAARVGMRWGFINKKGNFVINPNFEGARNFSDGLAPVKKGELWGCIDEKGKLVIDYSFEDIKMFNNGLAPAKRTGKWGFIDKKGKFILDRIWLDAWEFSEDLAAVMNLENQWGYINRKGKFVIEAQFDNAGSFSDGLAPVMDDTKWGYINKKGKFEINPQYDGANFFSEKLAAVQAEGKWGYVNNKGKIVIPFIYDAAGNFNAARALVEKDGASFYIDDEGKNVMGIKVAKEAKPAQADMPSTLSVPVANVSPKRIGGVASSLSFEFLKAMIKGAGSKTGESLAGWAMGAMGIGEKTGGMGEIQDELNDIKNQLNMIANGITQIQSQLAQTNCDLQAAMTADAVAAIQSNASKLNDLMNPASKADWKKEIVPWASGIAQQDSNVEKALYQINAILNQPAPGAKGGIAACSVAQLSQWKNALDEDSYYAMMHAFTNFFMAYQVQALNILTEAYHIMAVDNYGLDKLNDPKLVQSVCSQSSMSNSYNCTHPDSLLNTTYANLKNQIKAVGAGYASGSNNQIAQEGYVSGASFTPSNIAWLRSLDFAPADGCSKPLGHSPCGSTVGTTNPLQVTDFLGYKNWMIANYFIWNNLLKTDKSGGRKLSDLMYERGLGYLDGNQNPVKPQNLAILTGDNVKTYWTVICTQPNTGIEEYFKQYRDALCFMDTSFTTVNGQRWPLCDGLGGQPLSDLLADMVKYETKHSAPSICDDPCWVFRGSSNWSWSSGSTPGLVYVRRKAIACSDIYRVQTTQDTMWLPNDGNNGYTTPTYRWPVLDISKITCKTDPDTQKPYVSKNPAGVYTMCGDDFEKWLATWIPPLTN